MNPLQSDNRNLVGFRTMNRLIVKENRQRVGGAHPAFLFLLFPFNLNFPKLIPDLTTLYIIHTYVYLFLVRRLLHGIFGEKFWNNAIIEATFWNWGRTAVRNRNQQQPPLTEEYWLNHVPTESLNGLHPNIDDLQGIPLKTFI